MITSDARLLANQAQAENQADKPNVKVAGLLIPAVERGVVERRYVAFCDELQPTSALGLTLIKRAATLAVRMEKCAEREILDSADRIRQAVEGCEVPAGSSLVEARRLKEEAGRKAAFDDSKAAVMARRYESAAERGFFRALKEFRWVEKRLKALEPDQQAELFQQQLGSFCDLTEYHEELEVESPVAAMPSPKNGSERRFVVPPTATSQHVDVPITIGRRC